VYLSKLTLLRVGQNSISPLHVASKWGRSGMVSLLLDNAAVIDCQTRVCICMSSSLACRITAKLQAACD